MSVTKRGERYHVRFRYTDRATGESKRFSRSVGRVSYGEAMRQEAIWKAELGLVARDSTGFTATTDLAAGGLNEAV